jgi:tRNA-splicing ligase RtcB
MGKPWTGKWERVDSSRVVIPKTGKMRTEGMVFASERLMTAILSDQSLGQVTNVAHLPGIVGRSMAMPDIHWGYGFPIGGVAAFDMGEGVVSPGGVGYDINCGVRILKTSLRTEAVKDRVDALVKGLFRNIPSGVGSKRKDLKISEEEEREVLADGAAWAVAAGFGQEADLEFIEEGGRIDGADPSTVSQRALRRGRPQLGTLGSGNHFVEIGRVDRVFDEAKAERFGLSEDQVLVMIHTGSRGLGHQVCDDAIREMIEASRKYGIELPDRQLCSAPLDSPEGKRYLSAMASAANYAFANRQLITHWTRRTFRDVLGEGQDLSVLYDVAHNIAKVETHRVGGKERTLCVHRKGATRAFGPGRAEVPATYRDVGQPVLIPGDMGRCSYILAGAEGAMEESFGSACHGAGRKMSRKGAMKAAKGRNIQRELADRGVNVRAASRGTLAEEMPEAYKDVADVVDVVHEAGLAVKVARFRPMGVIKG